MVDLKEAAKQEKRALSQLEQKEENLFDWTPKTRLGKLVKEGKITDIDYVLINGYRILEPEVVDYLLPGLKVEFIKLAISGGKFQRPKLVKIVKRRTAEGNVPSWIAMAVVGDENGHVGVATGKAPDVQKAMEKAVRNAKLNIISILRGCGSWECACGKPHSIPFRVVGKRGSVEVHLLPAPMGVNLVAPDEVKKVLKLAGIKDIWMQSYGQTRRRINFIGAVFEALKQLSLVRVHPGYLEVSGLKLGRV